VETSQGQLGIIELSFDWVEDFGQGLRALYGREIKVEFVGSGRRSYGELKKHFKTPASVGRINIKGAYGCRFNLIFDKTGLFTISRLNMPQRYASAKGCHRRLRNTADMGGALEEMGEIFARAVEKKLEAAGSGCEVKQCGFLIGNPWSKAGAELNLGTDSEFYLVAYEIVIGDQSPFKCGLVFDGDIPEPDPNIWASEMNEGGLEQDTAESGASREVREDRGEKVIARTQTQEAIDRLKTEAAAKEKGYEETIAKIRAEAEDRIAEIKSEADEKLTAQSQQITMVETMAASEAQARAQAEEMARQEIEARVRAEQDAKQQLDEKTRAYEEAIAKTEETLKAESESRLHAYVQKAAEVEAKLKAKIEAKSKRISRVTAGAKRTIARIKSAAVEKEKSYNQIISKVKSETKQNSQDVKEPSVSMQKVSGGNQELAGQTDQAATGGKGAGEEGGCVQYDMSEKEKDWTVEKFINDDEAFFDRVDRQIEGALEEEVEDGEQEVSSDVSGEGDCQERNSDSDQAGTTAQRHEQKTKTEKRAQLKQEGSTQEFVRSDDRSNEESAQDTRGSEYKTETERDSQGLADTNQQPVGETEIAGSVKAEVKAVAVRDERAAGKQRVGRYEALGSVESSGGWKAGILSTAFRGPREIVPLNNKAGGDDNSKTQEANRSTRGQSKAVREVMRRDVVLVTMDQSVEQVQDKLDRAGQDWAVVFKDDKLCGIVSQEDLKEAMSPYLRPEFVKWRRRQDKASLKIRVRWVMEEDFGFIGPEESVRQAADRMVRGKEEFMPVVDNGQMVGAVSIFAVMSELLRTV